MSKSRVFESLLVVELANVLAGPAVKPDSGGTA